MYGFTLTINSERGIWGSKARGFLNLISIFFSVGLLFLRCPVLACVSGSMSELSILTPRQGSSPTSAVLLLELYAFMSAKPLTCHYSSFPEIFLFLPFRSFRIYVKIMIANADPVFTMGQTPD